ncbi:hypothetical protein [Nesterenkonia pannonica]|uniref:Clp protease N-terminal domain-containing protein n=1 Tax=Nesterenkonia pannonica TaxID=1548602 RepID=UPI0021640ACC|nr:Clp protease N-terminal domain-containing protein [Nesterenkonia pannonica]
MDTPESLAVQVLRAAGGDPEAVSRNASDLISKLPQLGNAASTQGSPGFAAVLNAAQRNAGNAGHTYTSAEHLLHALATEAQDTAEAIRRGGATPKTYSRPQRISVLTSQETV